MAKACELCAKKANTANNVSHAQNKTKKKQQPNLHSIIVDGVKIKKVCSTCRRTINKQK
jgi:large subunit ribosomal protein L28